MPAGRTWIETGEEFLAPPAEEAHLEHLCDIVLKVNIQPEVERMISLIPEKAYELSSDPQGVHGRLSRFATLRQHDPDEVGLFGLLAAVFVRPDEAESYPTLLDLARSIGPFAREELVGIVDDDERFNDELRTVIRDSAADLLRELD